MRSELFERDCFHSNYYCYYSSHYDCYCFHYYWSMNCLCWSKLWVRLMWKKMILKKLTLPSLPPCFVQSYVTNIVTREGRKEACERVRRVLVCKNYKMPRCLCYRVKCSKHWIPAHGKEVRDEFNERGMRENYSLRECEGKE